MTRKLYGNLNNETVEITKLYARDLNNEAIELSKLYIKDNQGLSRKVYPRDLIIFQDDCTGSSITDKYSICSNSTVVYKTNRFLSGTWIGRSKGNFLIPISLGNNFTMTFDLVSDYPNVSFWILMFSDTDCSTNVKIFHGNTSSTTDSASPINKTYMEYCASYHTYHINKMKIIRNGTYWEVYVDESLVGSATVDCSNYPYIGFSGSYNQVYNYTNYLKNLLIEES